jgi:hypothetical protein
METLIKSEFVALHAHEIAWGLFIFVLSLVISSIACIFVIVRLPENYFHPDRDESTPQDRPRWRRLLSMAVKNIIGVGLVVLGLLMSLPGVPGQGLLTMFMGVVLLDLPGKRALERRIISTPAILKACNRLRNRFGKKPFTLAAPLPVARAKAETKTMGVENGVHGRAK